MLFSFLKKLRTNPFLRKISPGIRIKLAFFTGIFLSAILALATFLNYLHQTRILENGIMNKIEPSLRFINSVVTDFENLKNNLILIEEMRMRIKEKSKALRQYKKIVYYKEDSLLNRIRSIGKAFGINVHYDYAARLVDTPYSVYLSEREIAHLETIAKSMLKYPSGKPISDEDFSKIKTHASRCAELKTKISQIEQEIRESLHKIREYEKNISQMGKTPALEEEMKKLKVSIYISEKKQKNILREYRTAAKQFQKSLKPFYEFPLQKLSEIGLHSGTVRIISSDIDGNTSYDTSSAMPEQKHRFAPLEALSAYKNDTTQFFQTAKNFVDESFAKEYYADNRSFSVQRQTVYSKPSTAERIKIILRELKNRPLIWKKTLEVDMEISTQIKEVVSKLRTLTEDLKAKRIPASSDREYHKLYFHYRKLRSEREKLFAELNPYRDYLPQLKEKYENQIRALKQKITEINKELHTLQKGEKDESKKEYIATLKLRLEEYETKLTETSLEYELARENYEHSWQLATLDAFMHLRDAALFDFIQISYGNSRLDYLNYLRSAKDRSNMASRWNTIYGWIMSGKDETNIPEKVPRTEIKTLETGILAHGRSEIEHYMWQLDSTPLVSSIGYFSLTIDEPSLIAQLMRETIIGYNTIHIDKTEELQQIVSNSRTLLLYSSLVAVFSIIITYFFAGFIVKRITSIIDGADRVRKGDLSVTFPEQGLDEIETLGISLNAMMKGLREREEMKAELVAAGELQKHLLPDVLPKNLEEYYSIGSYYLPMQGVGGDYFDFIELTTTQVLFCIGDVSNHGIAPALVMAMLRSHLRGIVQRGEKDLHHILLKLNDIIFYDTPPHIFVTLCIGIIDRTTHTIAYATAGHPRPLLYRYKTQSIVTLESGGLPVGMDENEIFSETVKVRTLTLQRGDLFLLYTDGITEAMNAQREQYGEERLCNCIQKNGRKKIHILIEMLLQEVKEFSGFNSASNEFTPSDDIAIIALRRLQ
ncbi:MAG: SpoIIE family protein phosphatase [Spirochaetes bacterium]|nr:SpoIIE family protein phosphatase [Spirochaetota bacterium]